MARPSKLHFHKGVWESTIKGQTHYFGSDERKARHEFHRLMARENRPVTSEAPQTVAGAVSAWLALNDRECYARWLKPFRIFVSSPVVYLDDVSRDLLTRFALYLRGVKVERTGEPLSLKSIRHSVHTAAAVLRWAHSEQEWLATVPKIPKLPKPARVARHIPAARIAEILDSIRARPRKILAFIAETGCRPSEACGLRWSHVKWDDDPVCSLPRHKTAATGAARTIYLPPAAVAILRELQNPGHDVHGFVFTSRTGEPYTSDLLRKIMHRRGANVYALRHSFAQRCIDKGIAISVVAAMMGHTTQVLMDNYAQHDCRKEAAKLRLVS